MTAAFKIALGVALQAFKDGINDNCINNQKNDELIDHDINSTS